MSDNVSSFADAFPPNLTARREAREARAKKEKRTHLSDKQRQRLAKRADQMNFRCSTAFKAQAHALKVRRSYRSLADLFEDALALLEKTAPEAE